MSDAWTKTKLELSRQMARATYEKLLKDTELLSAENGLYTIGVSDHLARDWIEGRLNGLIVKTLASVVDGPVEVVFKVVSEKKPPPKPGKPSPQPEEDSNMMIRDHRKPGRYYIDNIFIRGGYAAKVGPGGIAVYNALVLHADNKNQDCWPSYNTIAGLCGMSKSQAIKKIRELELLSIIEVERRKKGEAMNDSNVFTLIDDGEWKEIK